MKVNIATPTQSNITVLASKRNPKWERHNTHSDERKAKDGDEGAGGGNVAFAFHIVQIKSGLVDADIKVNVKNGDAVTGQSNDAAASDGQITRPFGSLFEKFENRLSEQGLSKTGGVVNKDKPAKLGRVEPSQAISTPVVRQIADSNEGDLTQNYIMNMPAKPNTALLASNEPTAVSVVALNAEASQMPMNLTVEVRAQTHGDHELSSKPATDAAASSMIFNPIIDLGKNSDGKDDANSENQRFDETAFKIKDKAEPKATMKAHDFLRGQMTEHSPVLGHALGQSALSSFVANMMIGQAANQFPVASVANQVNSAVSRMMTTATSIDTPNGLVKTLLLRLQPEGLGQLEIALRSKNGVLKVHLAAASDEALNAIQQGSDELQKSLSLLTGSAGQVEIAFSLSDQDTSNRHTTGGSLESGFAQSQTQGEMGNAGEAGDHANGSNSSRSQQADGLSLPDGRQSNVDTQTASSISGDVYL